MVILRSIAALLPQSLVLLIFGAQLDLQSEWNYASLEFVSAVIVLFVLSPLITASLLITEFLKHRKQVKTGQGTPSLLFPGLAIFLFLEALAVDGFILSQLGYWADEVGFGM